MEAGQQCKGQGFFQENSGNIFLLSVPTEASKGNFMPDASYSALAFDHQLLGAMTQARPAIPPSPCSYLPAGMALERLLLEEEPSTLRKAAL